MIGSKKRWQSNKERDVGQNNKNQPWQQKLFSTHPPGKLFFQEIQHAYSVIIPHRLKSLEGLVIIHLLHDERGLSRCQSRKSPFLFIYPYILSQGSHLRKRCPYELQRDYFSFPVYIPDVPIKAKGPGKPETMTPTGYARSTYPQYGVKLVVVNRWLGLCLRVLSLFTNTILQK